MYLLCTDLSIFIIIIIIIIENHRAKMSNEKLPPPPPPITLRSDVLGEHVNSGSLAARGCGHVPPFAPSVQGRGWC
jgi:hypothetical protein